MSARGQEWWDRVEALFAAAAERAPAERRRYLEEAAGQEPELVAEVEALLASGEEAERLLGESVSRFAQPLLDAEESEEPAAAPGEQLGRYRLLRQIGRGGMGAVYLAERADDQFRQRVAVKVVKRGMDTDEVLRRFRYERQILAALAHPHIARLLDGGATVDGRPYLVMEYIEGKPIDRHAEDRGLTVEERLDLFAVVCQAVQYAHQNLVIHRDIKPSNILVSDDGEVKLLDFGIAKLIEGAAVGPGHSSAAAPETRTGLRIMTPEHAAPEQLRGDPVTTATDVYALGVLLYQLLTGRRPLELAGRSAGELEAAVLREEPVRPSTVVSRPELRRRLRGDLDLITLKALEKEPARRYQSSLQLLEDVERHRTGRPVGARPATLGYRLRKYAGRHRIGLAVSAAATAALVGFGTFHNARITRERDRAQSEAAKARTTTEFLTRLLGDAYPSTALGDSFSMGDLLARAEARVDSLADQPTVRAELLRTLGDVYREQGRFGEALPLIERAVAIHRSGPDPRSREAGNALSALGHLHHQMQDFAASLQAHQEELAMFSELEGPDDSLVLYATNNVATAAMKLGRHEEALKLYRQILERRKRLFGDSSALVHTTLQNLGALHHEMGRLAESERYYREALAIRRAVLGSDHPSTALTLNNLANLYNQIGRYEEAESLLREALQISERVFGPEHPQVALAAYNLGGALRKAGRYTEAEPLYRRALAIDRMVYGETHTEIGVDLFGLGRMLSESGECERAVPAFSEALAIFARNRLPPEHPRQIGARGGLGECLTTLGRFSEAEPLLLESHRGAQALGPADSTLARTALERVIALYRAWERPRRAAAYQALLADANR